MYKVGERIQFILNGEMVKGVIIDCVDSNYVVRLLDGSQAIVSLDAIYGIAD